MKDLIIVHDDDGTIHADWLVRCKDCKRYWAEAHECRCLGQGAIQPDFYCGYGERKEGGTE